MNEASDHRSFLKDEFLANRQHADHINDHRLEFLKFFAGFVASIIGLTQFLLLQHDPTPERQLFLQPLLLVCLAFGLLTLLVLCNYWVSRDFMRLKNLVVAEELAKDLPSLDRYNCISKAHVGKLPRLTGMFAYVVSMVVIANEIVGYLFLKVSSASHDWVWLLAGLLLQVLVVVSYRRVLHGPSKALPK